EGNPWITVACQGLGASSWWACKDYQGDEPDSGMFISLIVPKGLVAVSNGKEYADPVIEGDVISETRTKFTTGIVNPINTYNASFYIGDYVSWTDTFAGEKGTLDLSFHVLRHHEEKA